MNYLEKMNMYNGNCFDCVRKDDDRLRNIMDEFNNKELY